MNKIKLNKVFDLIKKETKMDYAITNTDEYGDCNTCVGYALCEEYGENSTGIYVKHWLKGMNAGEAWKYLDKAYISHDITEEQADGMIKIFEENGYDIEPKNYDQSKAFLIKEKEI